MVGHAFTKKRKIYTYSKLSLCFIREENAFKVWFFFGGRAVTSMQQLLTHRISVSCVIPRCPLPTGRRRRPGLDEPASGTASSSSSSSSSRSHAHRDLAQGANEQGPLRSGAQFHAGQEADVAGVTVLVA